MNHELFAHKKTLVGVLHLPPLLGFSDFPGLNAAVEFTQTQAQRMEQGGLHGILLENENDRPHQVKPGPEILSCMTRIAVETFPSLRRAEMGVQILLNDPRGALAACKVSGGTFIRTDYFVDRMTRPEHGGEMEIDPQGLLNYRKKIGADHVAIFADIQVKYATMISPRPLEESAREAEKFGADAILVTSDRTGLPPQIEDLKRARKGAPHTPIWIGSGLSSLNAREIMEYADGAFVGSDLKDGNEVSLARVHAVVEVIQKFN